jgi:hypothetical protein
MLLTGFNCIFINASSAINLYFEILSILDQSLSESFQPCKVLMAPDLCIQCDIKHGGFWEITQKTKNVKILDAFGIIEETYILLL